jgi:hypothetical protein
VLYLPLKVILKLTKSEILKKQLRDLGAGLSEKRRGT